MFLKRKADHQFIDGAARIVFINGHGTFRHRLNRLEMLCRYRDKQLDIVHHEGWKRRHIDVALMLDEAIARLGVRRLPYFFVNPGDRPFVARPRRHTRFAASSAVNSDDIAAPDFSFGSWPEARYYDYDAKTASIAAASRSKAPDDRVLWIGRADNPSRVALIKMAATRPDLIDARDMNDQYDQKNHRFTSGFISMEDQVASHRYMIDVEGAGYSARLKLLLHGGRALLVQDRPWREWFFDRMEPFRHFVPVARDFSDLIERLEWLRANPEREAAIIAEAQRFAARQLTRAAAITTWTTLLEAHIATYGRLKPGAAALRESPSPEPISVQ